jgi:hypothetical protein
VALVELAHTGPSIAIIVKSFGTGDWTHRNGEVVKLQHARRRAIRPKKKKEEEGMEAFDFGLGAAGARSGWG